MQLRMGINLGKKKKRSSYRGVLEGKTQPATAKNALSTIPGKRGDCNMDGGKKENEMTMLGEGVAIGKA